jgi:homogentisate 1,2-dioxygenase
MSKEKFLGSPEKLEKAKFEGIPSSVFFDDESGGSFSPSPLKSPIRRPTRIQENIHRLELPSLTTPVSTQATTKYQPTTVAAFSGLAGTVQHDDGLLYLSGFGNSFESECLPGALPRGRNNPREVPFNLYTEQLSGTAFTAPRKENRRTWLYRIQPSVAGVGPTKLAKAPYPKYFGGVNPIECEPEVNPLRWKPIGLELDETSNAAQRDFVSGMRLMCQAGDPAMKSGLAIYTFAAQVSMRTLRSNFSNSDGDMLIVPELGTLDIYTEMGRLTVGPAEIAVIPRGMLFQVNLVQSETFSAARGYVLEVYNSQGFQLPERGPIGSNGLANTRDFLHPVAWCVDKVSYRQQCRILTKSSSQLFQKMSDHSPYNVVAWHGNYLPYKYDLTQFCAVGSVSYDHLDPSIYTVLTCPTVQVGTAMANFVIFPPRLMATDSNTLRPRWFHRNTMSEFMGLVEGQYDAKGGFVEGGASLHNCMTPHGPDRESYTKAVEDPCENPVQFNGGLAFMFETCLQLSVAPNAVDNLEWRDIEYTACWDGLTDNFSGWDLIDRAQIDRTFRRSKSSV